MTNPSAGVVSPSRGDAGRQARARRRANASLEQIARPAGFGRAVPRFAGYATGLLAAFSLAFALIPPLRRLLAEPRKYFDTYFMVMPVSSLAWAVVLAMLAVALTQRKRVAWWIAVGSLTLYAVGDLLVVLSSGRALPHAPDGLWSAIGLVVDLSVIILLVLAYRQFFTKVRRGAVAAAFIVLVLGLAVGVGLGWLIVWIWPGQVDPGERLPYVFNHVVAFSSIDLRGFSAHHASGPINWLLGLFGALALIIAAVVLLRSQRVLALITADDEQLIRALLTAYGDDDSLGYFSTRRDKAAVFAPDGRAVITYRVEVGTCVAGGDPVGDRASWPDAIAEYFALCRTYGWRPAVLGASAAGARAYAEAGLTVLGIGDEAIVHAERFRLSGPEMKGVRNSVNRLRRTGMTVRTRRVSELSSDELADVRERSDAWRDTDDERGFAMALGRIDETDGNCLLTEAVLHAGTADEQVIGMLTFVPWGRTGASLDFMRRDRSGPNGVVEAMIAELAAAGDTVGVTRISLNFAAFRNRFAEGEQLGAGPVQRLVYRALRLGSRYVQMESLYKSNDKYRPQWCPRYLCFEDAAVVPRVGLAVMVAEGFVRLPGTRLRDRHYVHGRSAIPGDVDVAGLLAELAETGPAAPIGPKRPEQVRVRLAKLDRLRAAGVDAYPPAHEPTHTCAAVRTVDHGARVRVAGRIVALRDLGGVVFGQLRDWSGEVQVLVSAGDADTGTSADTALRLLSAAEETDLGDLVEVSGIVGLSRSGELSVLAQQWRIIGKCLHPLPDKWRGMADPEARVRQRYLQLAVDDEARSLLVTRSAVVSSLRRSLAARDFLEVETPILQQVHGGANAAPFHTHINAYDLDLSLRIAPELYLKRLCVGGVERVYEIGRNFRNEGVDHSHNPEFTSLEVYAAHGSYRTMLTLARELVVDAAVAAHGRPEIIQRDGTVLDISGPWRTITVHEAVSERVGRAVTVDSEIAELRELCVEHGVPVRADAEAGDLVQELYDELVEPNTVEPTFYLDFPTCVSPLTRSHEDDPRLAQRWDLVICGMEIGTAYSELTDPLEQRRRLTEQSLRAAGGDAEAMELDEDFLTALEYAMPPTGGLGIGVDRLVMLITGRSIRETLAFPLARPAQKDVTARPAQKGVTARPAQKDVTARPAQ